MKPVGDLHISFEDYDNHKVRTCKIEAVCGRWIDFLLDNFEQMKTIYRPNSKIWHKMFGPYDWTYPAFASDPFKVWVVKYKEDIFLVFSAKGFGTTIEVVNPVSSKHAVIDFLSYLYTGILEYGNEPDNSLEYLVK